MSEVSSSQIRRVAVEAAESKSSYTTVPVVEIAEPI